MSKYKRLVESIFDNDVNANALFHGIIVETARAIYSELDDIHMGIDYKEEEPPQAPDMEMIQLDDESDLFSDSNAESDDTGDMSEDDLNELEDRIVNIENDTDDMKENIEQLIKQFDKISSRSGDEDSKSLRSGGKQ